MERARAAGWFVWHFHDSRREVRKNGKRILVGDNDAKGFPDLVLVHPGRGVTLFRELKVPPNKPTQAQRETLHVLSAAGNNAGVWTPADWPTILATLTGRKAA